MHVLPRVEQLQRLTKLSILIVKAFVLTGLDVPTLLKIFKGTLHVLPLIIIQMHL